MRPLRSTLFAFAVGTLALGAAASSSGTALAQKKAAEGKKDKPAEGKKAGKKSQDKGAPTKMDISAHYKEVTVIHDSRMGQRTFGA